MLKKILFGFALLTLVLLSVNMYYYVQNKNAPVAGPEEPKTTEDSIVAIALGSLSDETVKHDSTQVPVSKEEMSKKLNTTEKEKNKTLYEKAKTDLVEGPFAKMSCEEIYQFYCNHMMEYAKTRDKSLLAKLPLSEDAKFAGCLGMADIKPKVDSVDRLVGKMLRARPQ